MGTDNDLTDVMIRANTASQLLVLALDYNGPYIENTSMGDLDPGQTVLEESRYVDWKSSRWKAQYGTRGSL
jgi:hypothetical protein